MTTLKISDLSVGDWVEWRGNICTISSIYGSPKGFPDEVALLSKENTCLGVRFGKELLPVPITPEILEKNDFVRRSDEFSIYEYTTLLGKILRTTQVFLTTPQSINVFLHDTTIERGYIHREKTSVSILRNELYVHDLQHALRLAGLDKEINL